LLQTGHVLETWIMRYAYVVISGTLTVTIKGQSVARAGTLAYTFGNCDGVWKIEAQAWGRTS
jgi:uncharacterized Zn-binding protein involved in type VI secretion